MSVVLAVGGQEGVSIRLELSAPSGTLSPQIARAEKGAMDRETLDVACRLMPSVDRELIARALELGPYRPPM